MKAASLEHGLLPDTEAADADRWDTVTGPLVTALGDLNHFSFLCRAMKLLVKELGEKPEKNKRAAALREWAKGFEKSKPPESFPKCLMDKLQGYAFFSIRMSLDSS